MPKCSICTIYKLNINEKKKRNLIKSNFNFLPTSRDLDCNYFHSCLHEPCTDFGMGWIQGKDCSQQQNCLAHRFEHHDWVDAAVDGNHENQMHCHNWKKWRHFFNEKHISYHGEKNKKCLLTVCSFASCQCLTDSSFHSQVIPTSLELLVLIPQRGPINLLECSGSFHWRKMLLILYINMTSIKTSFN